MSRYQNSQTPQDWELRLCGEYAKKLLEASKEKRWVGVDGVIKVAPIEAPRILINLSSVSSDKRRIPTAQKLLKSIGLIASGFESVEVVHEKYLEMAPTLEKAPEFSTEGSYRKSEYGNLKDATPYDKVIDAYKDLGYSIEPAQWIYIEQHKGDYDFQIVEVTSSSSRYSSSKTYKKGVYYPKAMIEELTLNIFKAKLEHICRTHPDIAFKAIYGLNIRTLNGDDAVYSPRMPKEWTIKNFKEHINAATNTIKVMQDAITELSALKMSVEDAGGDDAFFLHCMDTFKAHFLSHAPLYINSEYDMLKKLAKEYLEGKCPI